MLKNFIKGLYFIHNSPLEYHGNLKSSYCLINERWQLKISYYGLKFFSNFNLETKKAKELLWQAPEHLRETTFIKNDHKKSKNKKKFKIKLF